MSAWILPEEAEHALYEAEKVLSLLDSLVTHCDRIELEPDELAAILALVRQRIAAARSAARFDARLA